MDWRDRSGRVKSRSSKSVQTRRRASKHVCLLKAGSAIKAVAAPMANEAHTYERK